MIGEAFDDLENVPDRKFMKEEESIRESMRAYRQVSVREAVSH